MSLNLLNLNVLPGSPTPIYRQISDQICRVIVEGRLHKGERLPSFGKLAESLVVSPSVVRRAFLDLIDRGCCSGKPSAELRVADVQQVELPHRAADAMNEELIAARDMQLRLMSPPVIEGPGFEAAVRQGAVGMVGGDFHHVCCDDERIVDVIVGDVAGHGVTAGLVAASVESSAPLVGRNLPLAGAMAAMNQRLAPLLGSRRFVAMLWARVHLRECRMEIANAGLPDPYLLPPGGEPLAVSVSGPRLPLGSRRHLGYETSVLPFEPGTRLLVITDGITEATARDGEALGCERFEELLRRAPVNAATTAEQWLSDLLVSVDRQLGHRFDDDWTALVLRTTHGAGRRNVRPDKRSSER